MVMSIYLAEAMGMLNMPSIRPRENGWFAARPSGTENIYKIYAESFVSDDHLKQLVAEAQTLDDIPLDDRIDFEYLFRNLTRYCGYMNAAQRLRRASRMTGCWKPPGAWRATSYFASAIGGASEMTLLAERHGARTDLVAAAHSVRLVIVVVSVPFAMQWAQNHWGLQVDVRLLPGPLVAQWPGLLWLALATAGGALLMIWFKRTNPWFMGALLVSMVLTLSGVNWSAVPTALSNAAQLVIGVSLGVRFQREFVHTAPRWLASVATGTVVMMLLSLGFGLFLAHTTGLHPATLILGTSPGGIAEMAITAKVLQLGVPVVTAFQVCRLVAVPLMVGPLFQWVAAHEKTA